MAVNPTDRSVFDLSPAEKLQLIEDLWDEMRPEYDIQGGVRGKYYERHRQGTNVVLLEPDVAAVFHDSESVNRALRMLIDVARGQVGETGK